MAAKVCAFQFSFPSTKTPPLRLPEHKPSFSPQIRCAKRSIRTKKQRYPSEKKRIQRIQETVPDVMKKEEGVWRFSKLGVPIGNDPGKDFLGVSAGLLEAIAKVLKFPVASMLPSEPFTVVRKSFDARKLMKEPKFVYTVDMDVKLLLDLEPRTWDFISKLEPKVGLVEHMPDERVSSDLINTIYNLKRLREGKESKEGGKKIPHEVLSATKKPKVAVVGSGPSGLFASLVLAELGAEVTLIERGQAVEQRGRDIGALVVRRILQLESNFCFGEGGAGTWSDGKLVTRIGRNTDSVLAVMETLVRFGAPPNILVDGKPHLGTDRLIPLLRNFRKHLQAQGVSIKFGTRVDDLVIENGQVVGVKVCDSRTDADCQKLEYDAVVLAVGHSARDTYETLLSHNVDMVPKDFSVGLRIEHPQELINSIQYSSLASEVRNGRGRVPVADYKVVKYVEGHDVGTTSRETSRSCYSFCMCPGGQVVLTSTSPSELCINGMSFSRRASRWANAALVVTVSAKDFEALQFHGPLAGVQFQREFEKRAAIMGGGNFVVPVQTVTDFLENKLSATSLPQSSYRLGVKGANLHELFPTEITEALQNAVSMFDKELSGFISKEALLHGVETRTSSPVQIRRNNDTYESTSLKGLYPVGDEMGSQDVKLLGFWISPFVFRIEVALKLKGVEYEYVEEDLRNKSPLFLESNPVYKTVPVLIHGGKAICESFVILEYIEETWKQNPILPEDPYEKATVRFWAKFAEEKLTEVVRRILLSEGEEQEKEVKQAQESLGILDGEIKGKKFFGGDKIGYLDIVLGFIVHCLEIIEEVIDVKVFDPEIYPFFAKWMKEFGELDIIKENSLPRDRMFPYIQNIRQVVLASKAI